MLLNTQLFRFFRLLHDGEHAGFGAKLVAQLKALLASVTLIGPLWDAYEALVHHEILMFKLSKASPETQEISDTDKLRDGSFREVRRRLHYYANGADLGMRQAALHLLFILKPYDNADERNLFEETTFIRNLLTDINKPANAQDIAALPGFAELLVTLETLNNKVDALYTQRLQEQEEIKQLGKRANVRRDVDNACVSLIEAINSTHQYLTLSGTDAAQKANLEESAAFIEALVDQLQKVLSHRGHHKKKDDETDDGGTTTPTTPPTTPPTPPPSTPDGQQNPDTTNPAAPDTPNQNPGTGPHPLDPNEHPSMGEH